MAVGVGDEGPGEAEYPRIASKWAHGQLRELSVVSGRQVVPNLPDLVLDEVIVVE